MARRTLTDKGVAALKPSESCSVPDPEMPGHYIRVMPPGQELRGIARAPNGKQVWHTIGTSVSASTRPA